MKSNKQLEIISALEASQFLVSVFVRLQVNIKMQRRPSRVIMQANENTSEAGGVEMKICVTLASGPSGVGRGRLKN